MREAKRRNAKGISSAKSLHARFFRSSTISSDVKRGIGESLVLSSALYNCHTWLPLKIGQTEDIYILIMRLFRAILGKVTDSWLVEDSAICASLGLPTPDVYMRVQRLRFAKRCHHQAPPLLSALLQLDYIEHYAGWTNMLSEDLEWLYAHAPPKFRRDQGTNSYDKLYCYMCACSASEWKNLVKNAQAVSVIRLK